MEPQIIDFYKDNEKYKNLNHLIKISIASVGLHYDMSKIIHYLNRHQYKYNYLKKNKWCYFNHSSKKWELLYNDIKIKKEINNLTHLFEDYIKKLKEEDDDILHKNCLKIISKLKSSNYKEQIINECKILFYYKTF
tara:strand:- start:69 stop:476 length:408 start_codon:yes stop_codon:yes gene_type:complete